MADREVSGRESGQSKKILLPALVWLLLLLGCSSSGILQPAVLRATPLPTRTLAPTFTPTPAAIEPLLIITPPATDRPGVFIIPPGVQPQIIVPPTSTETFTPTPTPTIPTSTPSPTITPTSTATDTPTPFIVVPAGLISMRTGPGVNYPLVAQLGPGIPVAIVGRNTQGDWYQICCVNGTSVWVSAQSVTAVNDVSGVGLTTSDPAPTPTPTPTATETPTATPIVYPFERAIGPIHFPTNNQFLTIWAKLFIGETPNEVAAEGYFLEVEFEGFDRPPTNDIRPSFEDFELSAPPGLGNSVKYNYKYEFRPPDLSQSGGPTPIQAMDGRWTVWVKDGAGNQLSEKVTFATPAFTQGREVYLGWRRVR